MEEFKEGDLVILKENEGNYHLEKYFGIVFKVVSKNSRIIHVISDNGDYHKWFPQRLEKVKNTWEI